jgi:hypothetical protein
MQIKLIDICHYYNDKNLITHIDAVNNQMLPLQSHNLAKELRMYVEYSLIPGDLAPAIVWLSKRTTVELELLAKWHNVEDVLPTSRVSLMKGILRCYCDAQN